MSFSYAKNCLQRFCVDEFQMNTETTQSGFFSSDLLPSLGARINYATKLRRFIISPFNPRYRYQSSATDWYDKFIDLCQIERLMELNDYIWFQVLGDVSSCSSHLHSLDFAVWGCILVIQERWYSLHHWQHCWLLLCCWHFPYFLRRVSSSRVLSSCWWT